MTEAKSLAHAIARPPEPPARAHNMNTAAFEATPYGARALEDECRAIADSREGERNHKLNACAFSVAQLVAGGEIPEAEADRELLRAALACGIKQREARATITSAFKGGLQKPRSAPPSEPVRRNRAPMGQVVPTEPTPDEWEPTDDDAPDAPPAEGLPPALAGTGSSVQKGRIQIIEPAAIFAPLEAPDYVVDRVIRRGSLTQLVGYGGGFKTWTALQMVIAVGAGIPWLGRFDVKQGRALYLDYENGQYEMRRRAHAIAKAAGLSTVANIGFACMPPVYMSDPKFGAAVEPLAEGCSLLVVDTLKAANPGTDENDSNMRLGLDALRRVGEKTGCAFLVLVHSKKTSGSVSTIDPREAGRGSSAIYDAADTVFHATYVKGEPLRVEQTKARLGRPVDPFLVSITDTADGGVLVAASDAAKVGAEAQDVFENVVCVAVLECLKANPGASLRLVTEKLNKRHRAVSAALEQLERNGAARNLGDGKTGKWFAS
ncbi:MAG TPA: AAA family ATPase [Polyangiaceae bacterium]|nr:AAA family ATPase [Polyangiaceae bacterium]